MAITPLPSLDRTSSGFRTDVDTFFATQLPTFCTEANALQTDVNAKQITASAAAATATTKAGEALTSANNSATSEGNANTYKNAAQAAQTAAESALDSFDDRYLGSKAAAPTLDNDGNALLTGAMYWNSTSSKLYIWTGSAWITSDILSAIVAGNLTFTGVGGGDIINAASINGGQLAGLRNRIINGGMQVAQRGAGPFALTIAYSYLAVDSFFGLMATSAAGGMSQDPNAPTQFSKSTYIYRNSGSALTSNIALGQIIESLNLYDLRGQTVTFSFYAKASANFSAASGQINVQLVTGTTADQGRVVLGSWDGQTSPVSQSVAISTSWARYSVTGVIPSNALELAVLFNFTPVGTAGVSDGFYITGVQLELGSVATPFEQRPYGLELALCQRYYQTEDFFQAPAVTSGVNVNVFLRTTMRVTPTTVTFTTNNSTLSVGASSPSNVLVSASGGSTTVVSNGTMTASAEL